MDIYTHLIENIQNDPVRKASRATTLSLRAKQPDNKFYIPRDMRDIEKQRKYKEKRSKNGKTIGSFQKSHLIFQRPWKELNKAQKMNRIMDYAKQNNLDKQPLLLALEKRKIKEVNYDHKNGKIVDLTLKE